MALEKVLFLKLIDDGKLDQISEMKSVFSKEKTKKCPFCFQEISDQGKRDLIGSIEKVLSREVDIHEEKLKKCIIQELNVDFSGMDVLNSPNYIKCKDVVEEINNEIFKIREIILKKINHPYTPITDFESSLIDKLEQYELFRTKLQQEIENYNNAVKKIGTLKGISQMIMQPLHIMRFLAILSYGSKPWGNRRKLMKH